MQREALVLRLAFNGYCAVVRRFCCGAQVRGYVRLGLARGCALVGHTVALKMHVYLGVTYALD